VLAGIGGLTIDPVIPAVLRMRRFYVRPAFRRRGVGRRLAAALLARAGGRAITVNACPESFPFLGVSGFRAGRTRWAHAHAQAQRAMIAGEPASAIAVTARAWTAGLAQGVRNATKRD
jgi:GNAT superfamily N-acetyltransferase